MHYIAANGMPATKCAALLLPAICRLSATGPRLDLYEVLCNFSIFNLAHRVSVLVDVKLLHGEAPLPEALCYTFATWTPFLD